ncbi:MAG: DUF2207 domain-containing protein [Actinobacteria bacterium]|jgi:hypothetical protein|nr:MAG: DUF2207 domain-containing protein [Actinomycetota bacterium]
MQKRRSRRSAVFFFLACLAVLAMLAIPMAAAAAFPESSTMHGRKPARGGYGSVGAGGGVWEQESHFKSWEFERFDSDIQVHGDGSFTVRETQVVNFTGSFSFLTRDITTQTARGVTEGRTYGKVRVKDVEVFNLDGTPYDSGLWKAESYGGGELIRIEFQARDEQRGWIISYRVTGAMIYAQDYDRLYWNAVSYDRAVPIKSSRITVRLPEGTVMSEVEYTDYYAPYLVESSEDSGRAGEVIWWEARYVPPYSDFTIDVAMPKGTIQKPWPYRSSTMWLMLGLALAVFLAIVALMLGMWGWKGRDAYAGPPPGVSYEAPRELRPALMAMLLNQHPRAEDMTATVIDLAVRGKLKIHEKGNEGSKVKEFSFERKDDSKKDLLPYEVTVMKGLFKKGDVVEEDDVRLGDRLTTFLGGVGDEVRKKKLFYDDPEKTIGRYFRWAMALILLPPVILFILHFWLDLGYVWLLLAGTVPAGIAMWAIGHAMPQRTPLGSRLYWQAMGFREYLKTAEAGEAESMTLQNFQENLPYAMVLGMADRWAEMFAGILATSPEWYAGTGAFDTMVFASSLRNMSYEILRSTPSSSGSLGGGGGFSGGFSSGGFGGGSSGGGFGGGGSSAG